jgi:phage terminase small subunit
MIITSRNPMTLTNSRREQFAQHFVTTGNAAGAARAIGFTKHCSARGSDLLRRPDVQARVEELMRGRPALPTRIAHTLDAATLRRVDDAISFLSGLAGK